ncbi:MAG: hypothetical protein MZV64_29990 [Ignavibacteriales bacterium]|nr:hypothetical protein [Ignavibacteriales bacterium]
MLAGHFLSVTSVDDASTDLYSRLSGRMAKQYLLFIMMLLMFLYPQLLPAKGSSKGDLPLVASMRAKLAGFHRITSG